MDEHHLSSRTLRSLPGLARVGVLGLVLVIGMGQASSLLHMYWHYENRDERAGFTIDDIRAAYHGIDAPAPLATALERGHPGNLPAASRPATDVPGAAREALLAWLRSDKIAENYDNLDMGDASPAELLAQHCNACHARKVAKDKGGGLALEAWEDVRKVAFAKTVNPVPIKVLAISTHTHALSLAALSGVVVGLALWTGWMGSRARGLVLALIAINGVGLALDIASWWGARQVEGLVYVIVAAGGAYNLSLALLTVLVGLDALRLSPRRAG